MPSRTIIAGEKSMPSLQISRDRVTFLLGANAVGDFTLKPVLAKWLSWLEGHPTHQKVGSWIPSQGTHLACRFSPQYGQVWEATNRCFSFTSVFLSLPVSLKINKHIFGWGLEEKFVIWKLTYYFKDLTALKNYVKSTLLVLYKWNNKAWMTAHLFIA